MVDRLQDVPIAISDVSILPVERYAVIGAVLVPEAQRGAGRHRPELLIEGAISQGLIAVLLAMGLLLRVAASKCCIGSGVWAVSADYRIVDVGGNDPRWEAAGLQATVLDQPAITACRRWRRSRCRRRCRRNAWARCWSGSRRRVCQDWSFDHNEHRRPCFKETYRCSCRMWRLVGIEPEIVQGAPANRIRVLVLCKGFRRPANGIASLSNRPWRTTVALVVKRSVVCPAGFLRWCVKIDVVDIDSGSYWHTRRLTRTIEAHVVEGILIMPDSSTWIGHLVSHEPDPIISWIGLHLAHCRAASRPGHDSRLHAHGRSVR